LTHARGRDLPDVVAGLLGARAVASRPVGGGDASEALAVRLAPAAGAGPETTVFVKTPRRPAPAVSTREAEGLAWLGETATVRVPRVLAVRDDLGVLVLEWIGPEGGGRAPPAADHDERLGRALAGLHRAGCAGFGADHDNYVGALAQANGPAPTWPEFYGRRRIEPLVRRAVDEGRLPPGAASDAGRLIDRLPELTGPDEPPARLHGDLWVGNVLTDAHGGPVLVDPAAYGGHREVDLAMMRLFGGFSSRVFAAYDEAHPLAPGHGDRVALYQLYPLLVHVVLFGGGYAAAALDALRRYR
jgi:fructosamine-3-kinase